MYCKYNISANTIKNTTKFYRIHHSTESRHPLSAASLGAALAKTLGILAKAFTDFVTDFTAFGFTTFAPAFVSKPLLSSGLK